MAFLRGAASQILRKSAAILSPAIAFWYQPAPTLCCLIKGQWKMSGHWDISVCSIWVSGNKRGLCVCVCMCETDLLIPVCEWSEQQGVCCTDPSCVYEVMSASSLSEGGRPPLTDLLLPWGERRPASVGPFWAAASVLCQPRGAAALRGPGPFAFQSRASSSKAARRACWLIPDLLLPRNCLLSPQAVLVIKHYPPCPPQCTGRALSSMTLAPEVTG